MKATMKRKETKTQLTDTQPSETSAALLRELVAHLRQNRTQLREEWARRITDAQLLTAMSQEEIFSEATSVYDNYVEVLETGSVQESLTNVYKYADATRVQVIVKKIDDNLRLTVRDNGKGFRPDQLDLNSKDKSGMGLMGMQERLRLVNGQFAVESEPGKGTTIRATIPFKAESQ